MRRVPWTLTLGIGLVALSAILYVIHFAVFRDAHHIFIYLLGDIAFVPVEVLLVTVVIHRLLGEREKRTKLEKLNMVIGAFFSEVGTKLLTYFSDFDPRLSDIRQKLVVRNDWSRDEFRDVNRRLRKYEYGIEIKKVNLVALREFLLEKRDFMLRLLENPNLLEHESFTELLRGVFHLIEEVAARDNISELPASDYQHIAGDIKRVYVRLVHTWLDYMQHLRNNYPYLFSLAMRTNPFDLEASPVVS
jgi:hypothetical protein